MRARARAVAGCAALRRVVGSLDLAGLSWRRLRAFQRGAGCLSDCRSGHTFGPWCVLGQFPGLKEQLVEARVEPPPAPLMTDPRLTRMPELLPFPAGWAQAFTRDGTPMWAAVQAWNEASDDSSILQIRTRARQLAEQRLTGPQRVRAALREQGLASTGGDSPQWRLPENWPPRPAPLELVTCADRLTACTHAGPHVPVGKDGEPVDRG